MRRIQSGRKSGELYNYLLKKCYRFIRDRLSLNKKHDRLRPIAIKPAGFFQLCPEMKEPVIYGLYIPLF